MSRDSTRDSENSARGFISITMAPSFSARMSGLVKKVTPNREYLSTKGTFPLFRIVVGWCTTCSLLGAIAIWLFERRKVKFFDCLFFAVSATTNTGLATVDILSLSQGSWATLCVLALAGSSVLLSILPVVVRMHYLQGYIPMDLRTFDLRKFRKVPLWVVEYKALQLIRNVVLFYVTFFLCFGVLAIWTCIYQYGEERVMYKPGEHVGGEWHAVSPLSFSVFTAVMGFTNSGLSLRPTLRGGGMFPGLLAILDVLALAGNTFFPVLLRWSLVFLSWCSAVESSRKVYFRYLILNGRSHYASLFSSQQTWLLLALQLTFLSVQTAAVWGLGSNVNFNQAFFMSVNTRHAGFSAVDLGQQNAGVLVLFLGMMFLAPTPFVVVLQQSSGRQNNGPEERKEAAQKNAAEQEAERMTMRNNKKELKRQRQQQRQTCENSPKNNSDCSGGGEARKGPLPALRRSAEEAPTEEVEAPPNSVVHCRRPRGRSYHSGMKLSLLTNWGVNHERNRRRHRTTSPKHSRRTTATSPTVRSVAPNVVKRGMAGGDKDGGGAEEVLAAEDTLNGLVCHGDDSGDDDSTDSSDGGSGDDSSTDSSDEDENEEENLDLFGDKVFSPRADDPNPPPSSPPSHSVSAGSKSFSLVPRIPRTLSQGFGYKKHSNYTRSATEYKRSAVYTTFSSRSAATTATTAAAAEEEEEEVPAGGVMKSSSVSPGLQDELSTDRADARAKSRGLAITFAESSRAPRPHSSSSSLGYDYDDRLDPGARRRSTASGSRQRRRGSFSNPHVDTRLLLLKRYGGKRVPLRAQVQFRAFALRRSVRGLVQQGLSAGLVKALACLWVVWFGVVCVENFKASGPSGNKIFNTIFEICSAYGNVGLSVGGTKENTSFSADLHAVSQLVIILVMFGGHVRELPSNIDGSLQLTAGEIISSSFLRRGAVARVKYRPKYRPPLRLGGAGSGEGGGGGSSGSKAGAEAACDSSAPSSPPPLPSPPRPQSAGNSHPIFLLPPPVEQQQQQHLLE